MNGRKLKWISAGWVGLLIFLAFRPAAGMLTMPATANESLLNSNIEQTDEQVGQSGSLNAAQPVELADARLEAELLKSTVQIRLYIPRSDPQPVVGPAEEMDGRYLVMKGLGSVVIWQGVRALVTHNHWGNSLKEAEYVTIYDAEDYFLLKLAIHEFTSLILYSDPGTLVLNAPTGLPPSGMVLGEGKGPALGDTVRVAHQDLSKPGQVNLIQAVVTGDDQYRGLPVLKVAVEEGGRIIPGDSGGGIWYQGELVGNTWVALFKTAETPIFAEAALTAPLPVLSFEKNLGAAPSFSPENNSNSQQVLAK